MLFAGRGLPSCRRKIAFSDALTIATDPAGPEPESADQQRRKRAALSNVMFSVAAKAMLGAPPAQAVEGSPSAPGAASPPALDADSAQNQQERKLAFLDAPVDKQIYSLERPPLSDNRQDRARHRHPLKGRRVTTCFPTNSDLSD